MHSPRSGRLIVQETGQCRSAVRFTDLRFTGVIPSNELLGYYQAVRYRGLEDGLDWPH